MVSEICKKCKTQNKLRPNGRYYCLKCQNETTKEWRKNNRNSLLERRRADYKIHSKEWIAREKLRRHPIRGIYGAMIQRCYNQNNQAFKWYGGRGISVCDRWLGKDGFDNFVTDMYSTWLPGLSIDRYPDRDGNYEPGNVRWATQTQQMLNVRTNVDYKLSTNDNEKIEYLGEILTLREFSDITGIDLSVVKYRYSDARISNIENISAYILDPFIKGREFRYRGRDYNARELEIISNINNNVLRYRLRNGWDPETALSTPVRSSHI